VVTTEQNKQTKQSEMYETTLGSVKQPWDAFGKRQEFATA